MNRFQHSRPYLGPSSDFGTPQASRLYNRSLKMLNGNEEEAFRLNEAAAHSGMRDAVLAMGWFYLNGFGISPDEQEAYRWYRKSARQGDERAMFSLGQMAYSQKDYGEALIWFKRAIEKDHDNSKFWVGKMYWRGEGVREDRKLAWQMFADAASKRVVEAQRAIRYLNYLRKHSTQ